LEIVSEVIFATSLTPEVNDPPEDELVAELIETVIPSTGSTQQISPLKDHKADNTPVIRSYLLQLLLDYKWANLKFEFCQFLCMHAACTNTYLHFFENTCVQQKADLIPAMQLLMFQQNYMRVFKKGYFYSVHCVSVIHYAIGFMWLINLNYYNLNSQFTLHFCLVV